MGRQQSELSKDELAVTHRLVGQVSRAFFDPPYVIVLDRMMTQEVWLEGALTDAVGLGANKKDLLRFIHGLSKQRLVRKFTNTELNDGVEDENGEVPKQSIKKRRPRPDGPPFGDKPGGPPGTSASPAVKSEAVKPEPNGNGASIANSVPKGPQNPANPAGAPATNGNATPNGEAANGNTEEGGDENEKAGQSRGPIRMFRKRVYYYLDLWEFAQVTKYRLGMMRRKIEGTVKQEVTKQDYRCPTCGKSFDALDVASLMQGLATSAMDPNGEFSLNCDVCGSLIDQKMNEEEVKNENDKVQKFNTATEHIRLTLQQVDRLGLSKFDVQQWLMRHVPQTVMFDRDERGRPIRHERQRAVGVSVEVTNEEEERRKKLEQERQAEEQRSANVLPVWHTHSTVSGAQTTLGMQHEQRQDKIAANVRRLEEEAAEQGKVNVEDADLADYYASLENPEDDGFEEVGDGSNATPMNGSAGIDSDRDQVPEVAPDDDDEEMDMDEAIDETALAMQKRNEGHENVMVSVGGKMVPQSELNDDHFDQMSAEEYQAYWRLVEDQEQS